MNESNPTTRRTDWLSRPLCGSYFLVIRESMSIQLLDGALVRDQTVCWALGVLADGSNEVLGVWPASMSGGWTWQQVSEDLKARGVEKIRFICALGVGSSSAMPRGGVRTLHASEKVMQLLQRRANRAVRRRGPFSDIADASAFLGGFLSRTEQSVAVACDSGDKAVENLFGTSQRRSRSKRVTTAAAGH